MESNPLHSPDAADVRCSLTSGCHASEWRRPMLPGSSQRRNPMSSSRRAAPVLLALFLVSCAGPAQLAKMSEHELKLGQLQRAYDYAFRAVKKDPDNGRARQAMTAASVAIVAQHRARILELIADR